jgi:predicted nucleotidyltransferase
MALVGALPTRKNMDYQKLAESTTILRCLVGSQAYGTSVDEGQVSDRDEKGVCIEPLEVFMGFNGFEQYEFRSAEVRTGVRDAKSEPGDLDLVIYSLHKFLRLALKGNPQIVEMFFLPPIKTTEIGKRLQALAPYVVSRACGGAYLGYMKAQKARLLGERGGKDVNRPELVQKYGYDTKYAMHVVRLGLQGCELLSRGYLTLPLPEPERTRLLGIREGKFSLSEVSAQAEELEQQLKSLLDTSPLAKDPDQTYVENWMIKTYWDWWQRPKMQAQIGNIWVN